MRNVVLAALRRALADAEQLLPERIVAGRGLLTRAETLLAALAERGCTIFRPRKLEGPPLALALGITETIVENASTVRPAIASRSSRSTAPA